MKKVDHNLILSAQNNDKNALNKLIKSQEKYIYSTILALHKSDDDIFDIEQNILIKMSEKLPQLKNTACFRVWLNQIIVHSYFDYLRKKKKLSLPQKPIDDIFEGVCEIADEKENTARNAENKELKRYITKSIKNLPEHYRIPITLRDIAGYSYQDISKFTNTAIGTVKSRIARARSILKEELSDIYNS